MDYLFTAHLQIRENLSSILARTPLEQLLYIPDGFNNHIFWNIAHCVATQQLLHYYLTGNDFRIDDSWIDKYKKGTLPNFDVTAGDVEDLNFLLKETSKLLASDYAKGYFADYQPYSTSFGLKLMSIRDAVIYNNMHECQHYGYVLAQKRAILGEKY